LSNAYAAFQFDISAPVIAAAGHASIAVTLGLQSPQEKAVFQLAISASVTFIAGLVFQPFVDSCNCRNQLAHAGDMSIFPAMGVVTGVGDIVEAIVTF
jgi:hypothetical protein